MANERYGDPIYLKLDRPILNTKTLLVNLCSDCGSLVLSADVHDKWHNRNKMSSLGFGIGI